MTTFPRLFLVAIPLAAAVGAMGYKIIRTPKAPIESDRNACTRLAWVERSGVVVDSVDLPGHFVYPRLSPDDHSALLTRMEPGNTEIEEITFADRELRHLTPDRPRSGFGVWSPHSDQFVFSAGGELVTAAGKLRLKDCPGADWRFSRNTPEDWSPDGRFLLFTAQIGDRPNELYVVQPETAATYKLLASDAEAYDARFSADGERIAFTSNRGGRREVYTAPFPRDPSGLPIPDASLTRVSDQGGYSPAWGPNQELFYISASDDLIAGKQRLFHMAALGRPEYEYRYGGYSVAKDGRFLVALLKQP